MTIQEFAEVHSVRVRRDGCSEIIIPGRFFNAELRRERVEYGSHIYENGDGRFGVCLLFATKMRWTLAKRKLIAEGFVLKQDGDTIVQLFCLHASGVIALSPPIQSDTQRRVFQKGIERVAWTTWAPSTAENS